MVSGGIHTEQGDDDYDPIQEYIDEYGEPDWWSALTMGWGSG